MSESSLTFDDYQALAEFRRNVRSYIRFSERLVRNADLEPRQYQLLLALKGLPSNVRPRIAELAEQLQIQHHSAVELVDSLASRGLVRRERGKLDRREVLLKVTARGEKVISELAHLHLQEVFGRGPDLLRSLNRVLSKKRDSESLAIPR